MSDDLLAVLPSSLAQDPEVYNAIKQLTLDAIHNARDILQTGSPAIQLSLIRSVLPAAARALAAKNTDDGLDDLKSEVAKMYGAMRDALDINPE